MKRIGTLLVLFSFLILAERATIAGHRESVYASPAQPPTNGLVLYDSFGEPFLSISKWTQFGVCYNFTVLECVREIQDGRARLAVRNYGLPIDNAGVQFEPSELHFTNPASIRSVATEFTVRRTSSMSCPANTNSLPNAHAHTLIAGNFFNSGSGIASDDLQGFLTFDHQFSDPQNVLTVTAFLSWQGQFFQFTDLGTTSVGRIIIAELSWDQPHSQLVARWTDVETGKLTQVSVPYTISDTTPAASPDKLIGVRTFTPNCIGTAPRLSDMESSFDNVWIGK